MSMLQKSSSLPVFLLMWVLALTMYQVSRGQAADAGLEPIAPIQAPFAMPSLQRPKFPEHRFNVREFGAIEGGSVKNTEAFAKAVTECVHQGGGHVVVPAGKWLTGPIHLQSNVDLHLDDGAEIIFSDDFSDYLPPVFVRNGGVEIYNFSPLIYARDGENVAVTGSGRLEGQGKAWLSRRAVGNNEPFKMSSAGVPVEQRIFGTVEKGIRPSFVSFVNCRHVLLEGFTVTSGPAWTLHPVYCEDVVIRRVHVDTHGPNNDGMDIDSCRNVLVEACTFTTGDDCLVLKSGYNEDGWRVNKPTENVVVRNCSAKEGHGGLVIGSEMSGGVRNVFMHDCDFDGTDHVLRIKSRLDRGGIVENVWVRDVKAQNIRRDVVLLTMNYTSDKQPIVKENPPVFRHIFLQHIAGQAERAAVDMTGTGSALIQEVHLADMSLQAKKGVVAERIEDCTFENVDVQTSRSKEPLFLLTNARRVRLQPSPTLTPDQLFLVVQGEDSSGIVIDVGQPSGRKPTYQLGIGAPADAVTLK